MSVHPRILNRDRSLLLVIDLQESYRGKLLAEERTVKAASRMLQAAATLEIPIVVTEQYPKGLGATREEIAAHVPKDAVHFEKTTFSALGADGLIEKLVELGRDQIAVVGIETHVCVNQTVHDLLARDYQVHVVRDAITARFELEDSTGFSKLVQAGATPASSESALFEWLGDARAAEFKKIHALVR